MIQLRRPPTCLFVHSWGDERVCCLYFQLEQSAHLNAYVQTAPLPEYYSSIPLGTVCTVSGWGVTYVYSYTLSDDLRAVQVPVISPSTCNIMYFGKITDNMVCAGSYTGGKDSCQVSCVFF